jgi:hypothetical protein
MTDKIKAVGSKAEVFHGTARHTSGNLHKKDLFKNKHGRIISRKKHAAGKKAIKILRSLGFIAKKGTFKLMSKSMRKSSKRHGRKHGGTLGATIGNALDSLTGATPAVGTAAPATGSATPKVGGRRRERRTRRKSRRGSC